MSPRTNTQKQNTFPESHISENTTSESKKPEIFFSTEERPGTLIIVE